MKINIKFGTGKKCEIDIEPSDTVRQLKEAIEKETELPADQQRLIFSGRVLKDEDALSQYKLNEGNMVHMVKTLKATTPAPTTPAASLATSATGGSTPATPAPGSTPSQTAGVPPANPFGMFGTGFGAGAMGNSFGAPDPNMMNQMLQNPGFAQYMATMLQNPAVLDSIIATNPQLSTMGPEVRNMMQSESFRQMIANPDMIRQMATLATAFGMNNTAAPGAPQAGQDASQTLQSQSPAAPGALPPANPFSSAFGNAPGMDPQLMAAMLGGAAAAPAPPADTRPPEERFEVQLRQMSEMGLWDATKNIRALLATNGNVNAAIEMIFNENP